MTPHPLVMAEIRTYGDFLQQRLLPELGFFQSFTVIFVAFGVLGRDVLGKYCHGSGRSPIIWIDVVTCLGVARRACTTRQWILNTTVLHELAHGIQEYCRLPLDDEEAEHFAVQMVKGMIWKFWLPDRPYEEHVPF